MSRWQVRVREANELIAQAERTDGRVKHNLFVRASRIVVDLTHATKKTRACTKALWVLERKIGAYDCVGCLASGG